MNEECHRTYRLRPYIRNVGIVCTLFFLCAGIGSVLAAYFNIDGSFRRPALAIVIFSIGWGGFTLLGLWLILAYFQERLTLTGETICQVGVIRTKSMPFDTVQTLVWRLHPQGGSCILTSMDTKIKLEFGNFTRGDKTELIAYLRQHVASERQSDWDSFHDQFLVCSPERLRKQQVTNWVLVFVLFGFAAFFAVLWRAGWGPRYLKLAVMNMLVGTGYSLYVLYIRRIQANRSA